MHYSRLTWDHSSPNEPVEILSEHDDQGWERRKIELFADGSVAYADEDESVGGSKLSLIQRPPDDEVVREPEFRLFKMTEAEFEAAWRRAHRSVASTS